MEIMHWFSQLWPGPVIRGSQWLFGFCETVHFMGLCILFGSLIIIDVRMLGFMRWLPGQAVIHFTRWAVIGFLINAASGWAFFTATPAVYWGNPAFKMKLILIMLAGANALVFTLVEHRKIAALGADADTPVLSKATAMLSLSLWMGVLLIGRLLPVFVNTQN